MGSAWQKKKKEKKQKEYWSIQIFWNEKLQPRLFNDIYEGLSREEVFILHDIEKMPKEKFYLEQVFLIIIFWKPIKEDVLS